MDLFKGFVNDSEYIVKKTSAFCMLIPGFKTLSGDDRISLLKSMEHFFYHIETYKWGYKNCIISFIKATFLAHLA